MIAILPDFGPARRSAAFRRLLVGGQLSALGSSMTSFALVLQIWDLSRSSLDVGLLGLTFVPVLIVGLLAWGLRTCYAIDTVSFVASLYATARLPSMRPPAAWARGASRPGAVRPSLGATAEGLHFIRHRPLLIAAFLTDLDAMLLGLPVALCPALNAAHFGGSPQTLGLPHCRRSRSTRARPPAPCCRSATRVTIPRPRAIPRTRGTW